MTFTTLGTIHVPFLGVNDMIQLDTGKVPLYVEVAYILYVVFVVYVLLRQHAVYSYIR